MHKLRKFSLELAFLLVLIPVGYGCAQSPTTLPVNEISKLIPEKIIKGYSQSSAPKSKMMQVGILRYSLVERNFVNGKKKIKILLFDYSEAPVMYKQATQKFETFIPQESDSLVLKPIEFEYGVGWENYSSHNTSTQILLGINIRFYLTIEGENVSISELKMILEMIPVERFPR